MTGVENHFDPGRPADPDDPPLIDDLEAFANGADVSDLSQHFVMWTEALGRIRVQEIIVTPNCQFPEYGVWV